MKSGEQRQGTHGACARGSIPLTPTLSREEREPQGQISAFLTATRATAIDGFSLLEMIGVVVVITILAIVLVPVAIRHIDQTALTKEVGTMAAISNALVMDIQRNAEIPNQTTWTNWASPWMMRSPSQISTNGRGFARLFFYDNGGWMNNVVSASYHQDQNGTGDSLPSNGRIAIVSTIANALPYFNGALATADFNSIWNASKGTTPAYLTAAGWTGKGYDLSIQRISLDSLFHHLVLVTRDKSSVAGYSINTSGQVSVPTTATGLDSYFLHGTAVGLWAGSTLTNTFILTQDISFTFDQGMWQAGLTGGSQDNSVPATNFAYQASLFIKTDNVPGGHQGATAQSLVSAFYTFMYAYTIWANECPHFQQHASSAGQQTDYQLLDKLAANNGIIDSAAGKQNGLLK